MDKFEKLKQEIAARATIKQLLDREAYTARLLAERVSEALVARRTTTVHECPRCAPGRSSSATGATAADDSASSA